MTGFVAALGEQGPARGPQHVFVNQRIVRDRTIAHAIQQAYSVATIKERSPGGPSVHRTPAGSRGRQRASDQGGSAVPGSEPGARSAAARDCGCAGRDDGAGTACCRRVRLALPGAAVGRLPLGLWLGSRHGRTDGIDGAPVRYDGTGPFVRRTRRTRRAREPEDWPRPPGREAIASLIRPMTPLGQFRNTFIIAMDDEGVAIIDQHVAHERILFEQISERLTSAAARVAAAAESDRARGQPGRASDAAVARGRARRGSGSRSRTSAAAACGSARRRRCSTGSAATRRCGRWRPISTVSRPAPACRTRSGRWRRRWRVMRR